MICTGGEVPLFHSQGGGVEGDGRAEKLYHGEHSQWLRPGNIQGVPLHVSLHHFNMNIQESLEISI